MKDLEENLRLRRAISDLTLDKLILQDEGVKQSIRGIDCSSNARRNF